MVSIISGGILRGRSGMHYNGQGILEDSYLRQRQQQEHHHHHHHHHQQQQRQQHTVYEIRRKARDRSCSPSCSDEVVRSPGPEVRVGGETVGSSENIRLIENGSPPELEDESRMSRYREENDGKKPSFSKQENEQPAGFFRDPSEDTSVKCFTEEMVSAARYGEPDNSPTGRISPQEYAVHPTESRRHSSFGKTSFCIDALLGRASGKQQENTDHDQRSERNQRLLFAARNSVIDANSCLANSLIGAHERESSSSALGGIAGAGRGEIEAGTGVGIGIGNGATLVGAGRTDDQRGSSLGNLLSSNPFDRSVVHHDLSSPSNLQVIREGSSDRQDVRGHLPGIRVEPVEESKPGFKGESGGFRVDRFESVEDEASIEVDPARTGSASSGGSNASHSPVSSPPISPGSEEPSGNAVPGNPNLPSGHYGALGSGAGVTRQNQALLLHPSGPLIHPGGLYYHPAGGSAFHSIHKEGQPVGHSQSAGAHPQQHHIHPLQLEWLARTGMLYPRLPADLAGEF